MLDKLASSLTSLSFRRNALAGLLAIVPLLVLLCGLEISQRLWRPLAQMAEPFSFGLGNLWRIAVEYPDSPVPPCVHRAPATIPGRPPRLLLIS